MRAIDELRALEREKRRAPASSAPFDDVQRRVEMKAREIFRMADDPDDEDGPRH
ncbi:MAG TPA: hypothetical protein VM344_08825 [Vitreimonas sp.]|nr:hypothetical protein [Vitreimonas sp.]